jgi:hypothetical protein
MPACDLLIRGGVVVDPAHGLHEGADVAIRGYQVVSGGLDAYEQPGAEVVPAEGAWVLPGLVDPHVHVSSKPQGYRMMARAGVTCALDMAGRPADIIEGMQNAGAGLTVGVLYPLIPGETVETQDPGRREIAGVVARALDQGALGVKVLGGHTPLSPDATARVIEVAYAQGACCGVHAGSLATGSNIEGLEDYRSRGSQVYVSFAVNSPAAAIALALARSKGSFAIPALGTDGGGFHAMRPCSRGWRSCNLGLCRWTTWSSRPA